VLSLPPPDDLAQWSLHCFCLGAKQTPHATVRKGNHGRVLFETGDWRSLDDLARSDVTVSDETLCELTRFSLLDRRDNMMRRAFPICGPDEILPMRDRMQAFASDLLNAEQPRIAAIADELATKAMHHSLYAVLFGEVMDGLLWTHLRRSIEIPDTTLTPDFPLWKGVFWAVYPPVPNAIGINRITHGTAAISLIWSERTSAMLNALRQEAWPADYLRFLLGEIASPPPEAISAGLLEASGKTAVPVFGHPSFVHLARLAEELAESAALRFAEQVERIPFATPLTAAQRNVILAHEYIWAMQTAFASAERQPEAGRPGMTPPTDARGLS